MNIFLLIVGALFLALLVFYIILSIRINAVTKQKKEDVLNSLTENEKNIIRNYLEACHVSLKECFTSRKKKQDDEH